jgi:nanoRNase/pAp phosphatase (c-di-AMP/oligoRNAs hydrolase)
MPTPSAVSQLEPKAKIALLKKLFTGRKRGLVLPHDNPDPDSLASALVLAQVLHAICGIEVDVAYGGVIGRAENAAFVRVLKLDVKPMSSVDLDHYDLFALVDTQQSVGNHSLPSTRLADIVIDHHPLRDESEDHAFADLGGAYGATSTMLTEYMRAAGLEPSAEVATALYYGIKADTKDLERQTQNPDVESYLWLFPQISRALLKQIEHPALPLRYFRLHHLAIAKAKLFLKQAVITDLNEVYSPDMVAEVAERMSYLEDIKWSLAFGSFRHQLYLSIRVSDKRMNAGRLVRELCAEFGGSAGGHGSMAGARFPLSGTRPERTALKRSMVQKFKVAFGVGKARGVSLLTAES